jgi:CheY-like chemotaxis protein
LNKVNPDTGESNSTRILLVDDDILMLDTTKELLEVMGYIVTTAIGSSEAIDLMKSIRFDVVVTDYSMPGMNGVEMILKAKKILGETPIILYTGWIDLITEKQITGAGIDKLDSIIKKVIAVKKKG